MGKFMLNGVEYSGGEGGMLAGLSDVAINSLSDGQILQWDATAQKFVNKGKVNADSIKTPADSNGGQRFCSRILGQPGDSAATYQMVQFTAGWQDFTGLIISRQCVSAVCFMINASYEQHRSNITFLGGNSSFTPTFSYNQSSHIVSITLKAWEYAYFIGTTQGIFLNL